MVLENNKYVNWYLRNEETIEFIKKLIDVAPIKVITLAPELDGMDDFIYQLDKLKINIQFGHSLADFECCAKFMNKYSIGFTHLYNAMSGNHHRSSGVLGAALELGSFAEIICDLNHVNKTSIKIAKKCIKNLYAVSDSMGATGLENGIYNFFGVDIEKINKKAVVKKTNALAGSVINMYDTFSNLIKLLRKLFAILVCAVALILEPKKSRILFPSLHSRKCKQDFSK